MTPAAGPAGGGLAARAMTVARACLLALAFTLSFSIALTEAALVLGLLALGVARLSGRRFTFQDSWLEPASLAVALTWLVSSALSREPLDSLFHVRKLYAMGLIWLAAEAARDPATRRRLVPMVLAGASLTAVVGFLIYAVRIGSDPGYRLQSLLSNQMTSAGVLAAASLWGLGAAAAARGARRWKLAAALVPLLVALALTQTRGAWVGFAVGGAFVIVSLAPRWSWTLPAGALVAYLVAPARIAARISSIFDPHEPGNQGRLSMWRSARDIVRDHPWFGVGCQDLLSIYRRYRYPDWTFESGHFHNNVVQIAVMTGIVGLAAFLVWHAAALRQLWQARRAAGEDRGLAAAALAVVVAMIVSGLFDFTFGDAEVIDHSYLALGLALAILPPRADPTGRAADGG